MYKLFIDWLITLIDGLFTNILNPLVGVFKSALSRFVCLFYISNSRLCSQNQIIKAKLTKTYFHPTINWLLIGYDGKKSSKTRDLVPSFLCEVSNLIWPINHLLATAGFLFLFFSKGLQKHKNILWKTISRISCNIKVDFLSCNRKHAFYLWPPFENKAWTVQR